MAITRLTDIITVFDDKWTYGDVKFGYDGEVNQDHDTQYPLMLVNPPESIMPVVYDGREEYSFEINFYNLYSQAAQSVVTLQKRWDNLQDLSNEWLDMVLKNYQDVTVEAYLNDESIEIERIKDTKNDKLVQIKLVFTMSAFTKCFRPVSSYPSDFADLAVWLRADSGVTFDIPTKKVSAWSDKSGQANDFAQATLAKQPLREGYGGQNDKAYFGFNGTSNSLESNSSSPIVNNFTIFEVSNIKSRESSVYGYYDNNGVSIEVGITDDFEYRAKITKEVGMELEVDNSTNILGKNHIGILKKYADTIDLHYYDSVNSTLSSDTNGAFPQELQFDIQKFHIGSFDGTVRHLDGEVQEVIIYNRALSDSEIADVRGYLNLKYKIY